MCVFVQIIDPLFICLSFEMRLLAQIRAYLQAQLQAEENGVKSRFQASSRALRLVKKALPLLTKARLLLPRAKLPNAAHNLLGTLDLAASSLQTAMPHLEGIHKSRQQELKTHAAKVAQAPQEARRLRLRVLAAMRSAERAAALDRKRQGVAARAARLARRSVAPAAPAPLLLLVAAAANLVEAEQDNMVAEAEDNMVSEPAHAEDMVSEAEQDFGTEPEDTVSEADSDEVREDGELCIELFGDPVCTEIYLDV